MPFVNALKIDTKKITTLNLRRLNFIATGLYLVEIIAMVVLKHGAVQSAVQTNFLSKDELATQIAVHGVMAEASRHLFEFNIIYLVGLGLLVALLAHILAATKAQKTYEKDLKNSTNGLRWKNYVLSWALMSAAAAIFVGVHLLVLIIVIALAGSLIALYASAYEASAGKLPRRLWQEPVGLIVALIPALAMVTYLLGSYSYGTPPSAYQYGVFLVWLIYTYVVLNFSLGAKRAAKNYLALELSYITVSFVALSALTWLICLGLSS